MSRELDFNKLSPFQQRATEYYFQLEADPETPHPNAWTVATIRVLLKRGWLVQRKDYKLRLSPAGRAAYLEAIKPKSKKPR